MPAVASEQPVPGQDFRQGGRLAGVDVGTAYAARAQQRGVAAAAADPVQAARQGPPVFPVLYRQCWPGMILQGQLLFPSPEAVDSLDK